MSHKCSANRLVTCRQHGAHVGRIVSRQADMAKLQRGENNELLAVYGSCQKPALHTTEAVNARHLYSAFRSAQLYSTCMTPMCYRFFVAVVLARSPKNLETQRWSGLVTIHA